MVDIGQKMVLLLPQIREKSFMKSQHELLQTEKLLVNQHEHVTVKTVCSTGGISELDQQQLDGHEMYHQI